MDKILDKMHHRKAFFSVVGLLLLNLIIIRLGILPNFDSSLDLTFVSGLGLLINGLIISMIITVFIGSFVFWFTPDIVKISNIEVVSSKEINPMLKGATTESRTWVYKGACGRFVRSTTLPNMADTARNAGLGRDISIYLLNPKNEKVCAEYAVYRRSLKSASNAAEWTTERVQDEVIATALTAMKYSYLEPLLRINVYFVNHFSAFRLDICDKYVLVTKEDKEASALKADAGTYFFDSYKDDVRLTERQSKKLECCGKIVPVEKIEAAMGVEMMRCADLFLDAKMDGERIERICSYINTPKSPY